MADQLVGLYTDSNYRTRTSIINKLAKVTNYATMPSELLTCMLVFTEHNPRPCRTNSILSRTHKLQFDTKLSTVL